MSGFRNPILPGFNPDPTIIRVDDDYFLATSSFEYFPGIPIYLSQDLINWKLIGHVLTRPSQLDLRTCHSSGGIFAPSLRHHEGRFYVTVSAVHRSQRGDDGVPPRGFHVWSDDIWDQSAWSDPVYHDVLGIDQDLFWDDDGTVYLSYATTIHAPVFRMYVNTCKIDITTGRRLSPVKTIAIWDHGLQVCEGPHMFKKDDNYYLITANGGTETEHQEWIYKSDNGPFGPWVAGPAGSVNPIIYNGKHAEVQQTGHVDLVEGKNGQWWAVFLAVRPVTRETGGHLSHLGRETFLAPVEWIDGWPVVNNRQPISLSGPSSAKLPRVDENFTETFTFAPGMDLTLAGWYHIRTPLKKEYDLEERPGYLALRGGPYEIQVDECIAALFQKQTAFQGEWRVSIDYPEVEAGHEAGVTIWWSKRAFASLGTRGTKGGEGRELVFRVSGRDGEAAQETTTQIKTKMDGDADADRIHLRIVADPLRYTFFATLGNEDEHEIGVLDSEVLVRPTDPPSGFVGTHFGLYAMGANKIGSMSSAYFSEVRWRGVRAGGA